MGTEGRIVWLRVHDIKPHFMVSLEGDGSKDQLKSVLV